MLKQNIIISFAILISRILGYIRDAVMAAILGAGILNDIFVIAIRLPNLFRGMLGEGAMSAAFIPIFIKKLNNIKAAKNFFAQIHSISVMVTIIITILMFVNMKYILMILVPGIKDKPEMFTIIINLSKITTLYFIFAVPTALYGSVLNSMGKFFVFAFAHSIFNIFMIIGMLLIENTDKDVVYILSWIFVISGLLEFLWCLGFIYKIGFLKLAVKIHITKDMKLMLKRMTPGIIGSSILQINTMISSLLASFITGGISYLYYADRIYQLPLALIGTATGTVLLPLLAKCYKENKKQQAIDQQNQALNYVLFFTIPASFALIVLAEDIIQLLFKHGDFSKNATIETAKALYIFAFGLPAYIIFKVLVICFYANGDTKTPVIVGAISLLINITISYLLLDIYRHVSIAIGSVISSYITVILFNIILYRRKLFYFQSKYFKYYVIHIFNSIIMVLLIYLAEKMLINASVLYRLPIIIIFSLSSYLLLSFFTGTIKNCLTSFK